MRELERIEIGEVAPRQVPEPTRPVPREPSPPKRERERVELARWPALIRLAGREADPTRVPEAPR